MPMDRIFEMKQMQPQNMGTKIIPQNKGITLIGIIFLQILYRLQILPVCDQL